MKKAKRRKDENKARTERERNKRGRLIWWCLVEVIISFERKGKLGLEKEE